MCFEYLHPVNAARRQAGSGERVFRPRRLGGEELWAGHVCHPDAQWRSVLEAAEARWRPIDLRGEPSSCVQQCLGMLVRWSLSYLPQQTAALVKRMLEEMLLAWESDVQLPFVLRATHDSNPYLCTPWQFCDACCANGSLLNGLQEEEMSEAQKMFKAEKAGGNYGAGTKEMQVLFQKAESGIQLGPDRRQNGPGGRVASTKRSLYTVHGD